MSFTPNIPQNNQSLGQTRDPIRNNFTNYNTVISVDHVAPNASGQGKHKQATMPVQTTNTFTSANEGGTYCKTAAGASNLFFQRDGVATDYRMTGPFFTAQGALSRGGTTPLFGGLQLKWGVVALSGAGSTNISFLTETGANFTTTCYTVVYSLDNSAASIQSLTSLTNTGFTFQISAITTNLEFWAIGD